MITPEAIDHIKSISESAVFYKHQVPSGWQVREELPASTYDPIWIHASSESDARYYLELINVHQLAMKQEREVIGVKVIDWGARI